MIISHARLMQIIIEGRCQCYIRKNADYNPYVKSALYDWEFKLPIDGLIFTDAYRGFNPYSGVECVYQGLGELPVWTCDYVGYVNQDAGVPADRVYGFLKEARGTHLLNCSGNLFSDCNFEDGPFRYETYFQGDVNALLQMESIFYADRPAAQQMTAGRLSVRENGILKYAKSITTPLMVNLRAIKAVNTKTIQEYNPAYSTRTLKGIDPETTGGGK